MIKKIMLLNFAIFAFQVNAQNVNDKIEKLLELDGTIGNIENIITETIQHQKQRNFEVSENFWVVLEKKVSKKSLPEFKSIVTTIYLNNFTESEIDNLIAFFSSETGKLITEKQPIILEQLNLPLMQWSENLASYIIEEIEGRGKNESSSEEIEKFITDFKTKYGLQILNLNELDIDQEHNVGSLLIDFGKTDGQENITKVIRVKNNSNEEITFDKPLFLIDDDIIFDWGNEPIQVGEIRDLKIILNVEKAESRRYSFLNIISNKGNNIPIGVKYDLPRKEIEFEISQNKLKYKKTKGGLSEPYIFVLKNTGKKDFYISEVEIDQPFAYISYSKETLKPNQDTEIRIIISNELINKFNIKNVNLNLEVHLRKGKKNEFSSFSDEAIKLKIE
jgi:hypothetical protein